MKIYKLIYNDKPIYIGLTKGTLERRKGGSNGSVPKEIYKESKIELIEETEDVSRERFWINHYLEMGFELYNRQMGNGWDRITHTNEYHKVYYREKNLKVYHREYMREYREGKSARKVEKTSKYKGVSFQKDRNTNKWRATIQINKVKRHIGYFNTEDEAYEAYLKEKNNNPKG